MPLSLPLWTNEELSPSDAGGFRPALHAYVHDTDRPRGAVLVCPGGGYYHLSTFEDEAIARRFFDMGFHAFVVHYRFAPNRFPAGLRDVSRAVRIIRQRAGEWGVDAHRIAVCGFSAGGHVAANLGVQFACDELSGDSPIDRLPNRPDALILSYPVITSGEFANRGSFDNLLGPHPSAELLRRVSLEHQVSTTTPPTFLWHTYDDPLVPVENSILFFQALRRHGIPAELHVYPRGPHGLNLAADDPHVGTWSELCGQWLRGMGW